MDAGAGTLPGAGLGGDGQTGSAGKRGVSEVCVPRAPAVTTWTGGQARKLAPETGPACACKPDLQIRRVVATVCRAMYDLAMDTEHLAVVGRAEALFREGFNCSQSVLMAFAPGLGMHETQAALVASAFGGGMARHGSTCGAVTGALMAIGLHAGYTSAEDNPTKDALYARAQVLMARFEARHGATACRQLTGANLLDLVERQAAADRGTFTTLCPQLVRTAAMLVAEALAVPRTGE